MGLKIDTIEFVHMFKIADMPIYIYVVKAFKNLLLQNQWTVGFGTWYV